MMPFYAEDMVFQDSIQRIEGKAAFQEMTERLASRSQELKFEIKNCVQDGNLFMIEWEMTLAFKKYPNSTLYGASRVQLNDEGQICQQRDYYDLWGDIFDNIPFMAKRYRKFMRKKFG
jgi:hypothetical protein